MGKIIERGYVKLIEDAPDRHANKMDIVLCKDGLYHVNFRNIQIKLTPGEFEEWRFGFEVARKVLGTKMNDDL